MVKKSDGGAKSAISTGPMPATTPSKDYKAQEDKWRAEEDLRTLTRAEEIQRDRGRMSAAKSHAREQIRCLSKVTAPRKK